MTGWILYDKVRYDRNKWFADRLAELGGQACKTEVILTENLRFGTREGRFCFYYMEKQVVPPDFVVCRTVFPLLSLALERAGSRVFNNSETARICNDKRLTYSYVLSPDIPSIETFIFDKRLNGRTFHNENEFPMIIKTAAGHGGEEVYLCLNLTDYGRIIKSIPSHEYAEQPLIAPCKGDIRVYVLGTRLIAAVLRTSDDYRSNYSLG